jgi:hypothetical protein
VQTQCLAGAGLVDHERRHATLGEPLRQAHAIFHFLGRIEAVDLDQDRRRVRDALGAHVQPRNMGVTIRDLDTLAILAGQLDAACEAVEIAAIELGAARRAVCLQALGGQVVGGRAAVLVAGRNQPAARLIFFGEGAQLVGHAAPGLAECPGAGGVGLFRRILQRRAHFLDLTDPRAHLDGKVDREIPDVVGGEVSKHRLSQSEGI